jgi:hypothetical protein
VNLRLHDHLLTRDHTLFGGVLHGINGTLIELQGRAISVLKKPCPVVGCCSITGMTKGPVREALQRIQGAFSKLRIPDSPVEVLSEYCQSFTYYRNFGMEEIVTGP